MKGEQSRDQGTSTARNAGSFLLEHIETKPSARCVQQDIGEVVSASARARIRMLSNMIRIQLRVAGINSRVDASCVQAQNHVQGRCAKVVVL